MDAQGGIVDEFSRFIPRVYEYYLEDANPEEDIEQDESRAVRLILNKLEPSDFRLRIHSCAWSPGVTRARPALFHSFIKDCK